MTVLSVTPIEISGYIIVLGILSLGGIIAFTLGILISLEECEPGFALWSLAMVAWSIFGLTRAIANTPDDGLVRIEATLDDTVPFVDIVEEYKFIEQRGDIYVFETLEAEEDE